jgi:hypothetical protein
MPVAWTFAKVAKVAGVDQSGFKSYNYLIKT